MIDFHAHILPGIDDGSKSVEESLQLLRTLAQQGVTSVVATPHFYAWQNSPEMFCQRRQRAWEKLRPHLTEDLPRIVLGGEVHYFEGISRSADLRRLCIEGTDTLLLEMPSGEWSGRMMDELWELTEQRGICVVLAHIERYLYHQPSHIREELFRLKLRLQSNASFFLRFSTRRKAMRLLSEGKIHVLGSDCHNMQTRPPQIGAAAEQIRRRLGEEAVTRLSRCAAGMIRESRKETDEDERSGSCKRGDL